MREDQYALYKALFDSAAREVRILTGMYDRSYGDEFAANAINFLRKPEHSLMIACMCGAVGNCPAIRKIVASPDRMGELKVYDAGNFPGEMYFALTDRNGYRLEMPGEEVELNFSNTENALRLASIFDAVAFMSIRTMHYAGVPQ